MIMIIQTLVVNKNNTVVVTTLSVLFASFSTIWVPTCAISLFHLSHHRRRME